MQAWRIQRHGKPSKALEPETLPDPEPGPGQLEALEAMERRETVGRTELHL